MVTEYAYIEQTGIILPDTAELKQGVEKEFRAVFGEDLVIDPESPEGVLITAEVEARDAVVRNNAALANQINPNYAGGVFLDAIASLTGLERRKAEPSLVVAQLRGVPSTIIPAGARVATSAGDVFASKKNVVLGADGRGATYFYSEVKDAIPTPVNSLTKILDPVLGWETITNDAPASLGQPVESDRQFRLRRKQTLFLQGVALSGALISALYDVPGVRSVLFRENITSEPKEIDGKTLAPHSIYVCVDGGGDEAVAQAIFANKSGGCGYNGAVERVIIDPISGQPYTVCFDRPEGVPIRARVTVRTTGAAVIDAQTVVRDAIVVYAQGQIEGLQGFTVGAGVSPFELAAAVAMTAPALFVVGVEVGRFADAALTVATLPLAIWQKASITHASIEVIGG